MSCSPISATACSRWRSRLERGLRVVPQVREGILVSDYMPFPFTERRSRLTSASPAGMIKSSPQKSIAQGTDWRFLNELKRELKGDTRRGRTPDMTVMYDASNPWFLQG